MEQKPGIESKIHEVLNSVKSIKPVDVPIRFIDKTVNRLSDSVNEENRFSYGALLKIAAIVILLIANAYTIKFILNPKPESPNVTVTVKDVVNEYQSADASELTFEENLSK